MKDRMVFYHGSEKLVRFPIFGVGNPHNDYGLGFYMTEHAELAKEWGCMDDADGLVNRYQMDMTGLRVLFLNDGEYHILNWLSILLENRTFRLHSEIAQEAKRYLTDHFSVPYQEYDVICGYRADDSYFSFASQFLNNGITLAQLERAMMLGELGEQYVLKSEKSFSRISFDGYEKADHTVYYPKKTERDKKARTAFLREKGVFPEGVYMIDILREGWENDDARLQRIVS